jgi:hypothetical protein
VLNEQAYLWGAQVFLGRGVEEQCLGGIYEAVHDMIMAAGGTRDAEPSRMRDWMPKKRQRAMAENMAGTQLRARPRVGSGTQPTGG